MTPRGAADVLTRPTTAALALAATAVLALAGCGSSSSKSTSSESTPAAPAATQTSSGTSSAPATGGGGATSQLSLGTNPEGQLKFDKSTLSAKAGKVSIAYTNDSPIEHNLTIESSSGSKLGATPTFTGGATMFNNTKYRGSALKKDGTEAASRSDFDIGDLIISN